MRVTHLNKSGTGWSSKTACGRNLLRTPIFSRTGAEFKQELYSFVEDQVVTSKQFEFNAKMDSRKSPPNQPKGAQAPSFNLKGELK
jgi:hypothetical protein